jgi:hypothetical protein
MVRPPAAAGIATAAEAWTAACVLSTAVPGVAWDVRGSEPKVTEVKGNLGLMDLFRGPTESKKI